MSLRAQGLRNNPLCAESQAQESVTLATPPFLLPQHRAGAAHLHSRLTAASGEVPGQAPGLRAETAHKCGEIGGIRRAVLGVVEGHLGEKVSPVLVHLPAARH